MASIIEETTKPSAQLQMALIVYGDATKLKLRQTNGWDFRGPKRGQWDIMAEILCYCNQQKTKTDIMHKVNLNYAQLKKHLKSLTSHGLLGANKNKYATTHKGHRFLELFFQLNDMLES
jgi:predicted transcriptional regulator